ncbi:MAG: class I SAM-dependent methyltransferase [Balneolaceae bacterium]
MSTIAYDPVKDKFSAIIRGSKWLRRMFYFLLDLFFLRSWHVRRLLKRTGREYDKKGGWQMLDAGSGFGQYDRFILRRFKNVHLHAVDVKAGYLEDCRHYFENDIENGRVRFDEADLLELNTGQTYHGILCVDVLEHIEDDVQVIKNLANHLKKGGFLLMHSPSHYSEEDGDEEDTFVGEHARAGYSKKDIRDKMEQAGLDVELVHYTYGFWGHKAWILSVKWPMIWFNKLGLFAALPLVIYYPVVMPFCLLMNFADLYTRNKKGNGIYALGVLR